eukprot:25747-Pleurochrysis_carterae.AAC.1
MLACTHPDTLLEVYDQIREMVQKVHRPTQINICTTRIYELGWQVEVDSARGAADLDKLLGCCSSHAPQEVDRGVKHLYGRVVENSPRQ